MLRATLYPAIYRQLAQDMGTVVSHLNTCLVSRRVDKGSHVHVHYMYQELGRACHALVSKLPTNAGFIYML